MGKIRLLDQKTVGEIAAGEVIERPASVVKELIENSIDAGARKIIVRASQGGIKRIEVIDDGEGMSGEDLSLCVRQHATSKLSNIDDLQRLSTYGFRGEALSSIASVSSLTVRSRTDEEEMGTELSVAFGEERKMSNVGMPRGTTVIAEDLFLNVPARRKHLSSPKTELRHIASTVVRYAVSWPETAFDLYHEDRGIHSFRGAERAARIAQLVGPRAAGRLVDIGAVSGESRVSGELTKMDVTRSSPASIFIFVNRRPVASTLIQSAIADGYGTRLMRGRYPIGYVMVDLPPDQVDANVHPTKREVRFADPERIRELVIQAVEGAFAHEDATPRLGDLMEYTKVGRREEALGRVTGRAVSGAQAELDTGQERAEEMRIPLEPIFQLFDTYIVAKGADESSVVLIDQHAAAERIAYERILRSLKEGKRISQELLSPVLLDIGAAEMAALEENIDHIRGLGFDIESFGGGSYRLRGVPLVLGREQGERALLGVLDDLSKAERRRPLGEELVWRVACHGSIRAGERLRPESMRRLIAELIGTDNPYTCEHGRPTMISLTSSDLERLFKRQI